MGTLSANVISTVYKKLIFTNATSGASGKLYYTLDADGTTDTELTTLASKMSFTLGIQLSNGIVYDSNGNESIELTATSSAVNHLGITNAAAGNAIILTTVGTDSNVGMTLTPKGTGVVTSTPLLVATLGVKLGNNVIYNSEGTAALTLDTDEDLTIAGDLTVTGNEINSSGDKAITLSNDDVTVEGDLTVTGASSGKITLGADADGTDRSIVFGHTTLKSIMGIDDDQDVFAINTDAAFQSVNDFEIAASGLITTGGALTTGGVITSGGSILIPDAGNIGSASDTDAIAITSGGQVTFSQNIVQSAGGVTNTFAGTSTFNGLTTWPGNTGPANGAGIDSDGSRHHSWIEKVGGVIKTSIYVDIGGLASTATDLDVIGLAAGGVAHIGLINSTTNGTIFAVRMTCLETPTTGADEIDLYNATDNNLVYDNLITDGTEDAIIKDSGAWTTGVTKGQTAAITMGTNEYLYLTAGEAGTAGTYGAGKFLIELWGA
jgi:hypothetical protein